MEAERTLPADVFPSLAAINRAGVQHDATRLFELGLDGLVLALRERLSAGEARPAPRSE